MEKRKLDGKHEATLGMILRIGEARFGAADASIRAAFEAIDNVDRLERNGDRNLVARDWNDTIKTTADSKI